MDLDGDLIMQSTKVRNLVVLIDSTLSYNDHIGKDSFFSIYVISLVFDPLSVSMMLKL